MSDVQATTKKSFVEILKGMGKEYYLLSAMLFFFFVSWAGCYSLLAVWLQRFFELNGAQIGFAYGVFSITALVLSPVYGMVQDRLILRRHLMFFVGVMLALCGPYYIFIIEPLLRTNVIVGSVALGLYMGFAFQAGIGALESYTERFGRVAGFEFGHARMWGTLGWASTVAITGILINIDPHYNFYLSTIAGVIFFVLLIMLNTSEEFSRKMLAQYKSDNQKKSSFGEIGNLLKMPAFWAVIVWVLGSSMYGVYDQQFMRYFVSKFADEAQGAQMYGFLNSTQVFIETICTFLAPFVVNKIGAKNGLIIASTIMFCRIGLSGLVDSTWAIAAVKLLHGPEVPMVIVSFFKYITTRFNPAMSATIYLVAFTMLSQIVSAVLAPVAGYFYDNMGFAHTYLLMAAFVLCTTIVSIFALTNKTLPGTKEANI
ncbi:MAG TPA: oligosaccharide MFS transporter [Candidatus Anaerobiospirillum stercoravium]|nr:oligosaccharide MFS transporter [Candidatus Anaerobiospirillum stercoravium]